MAGKLCLTAVVSRNGNGSKCFRLFRRSPDLANLFNGRLTSLGIDRFDFQKLNAGEDPGGHIGLDKAVEDVTAFAAFGHNAVHAQDREVLRGTGVADAEHCLQRVDIPFAVAEFFHDADAVGMGEDSEEFSEFFCDYVACRHGDMNVCTCSYIR